MPFFFSHTKSRSVHASMARWQSNYEWGTCSRSLYSNCLRQGSSPYSPHYKPTALTNQTPCLRTSKGEQFNLSIMSKVATQWCLEVDLKLQNRTYCYTTTSNTFPMKIKAHNEALTEVWMICLVFPSHLVTVFCWDSCSKVTELLNFP